MMPIFGEALKTLQASLQDPKVEAQVVEIAALLKKTLAAGNKILLCGNGGSAAEAQHIAAEFVGRFQKERKGLPAISLTTDTSILTSVANDYSYETIFARQVEALGQKGDVLILLTTSGNSKNCLAACRRAKEQGLKTVAMAGSKGGAIKELADICLRVPSDVTAHIQEVHLVVLHAVCAIVDENYPSC